MVIVFQGRKTLVGSAAFLSVTVLVGVALAGFSPGVLPLLVVASLALTGVEASIGYGLDNLPIPPIANPFPSGVTFSGSAFSEPRLIALAYAFEQATHHRVPPASTPPLPGDSVSRP